MLTFRPKLNKPKDILLNYKIKTKKMREKNVIFFSIFRDQHDTTKANRKFCILKMIVEGMHR